MPSKRFHSNQPHLIWLGLIWLLVAALLLFFQLFKSPQVKIAWDTATEQNTAGFYIYRSTAVDGEYDRVTDELIPSQGSAVSGADYAFVDESVKSGETYYYVLEEIEYDTTTNRYTDDIISRYVPLIEVWAVVLIALALLVGIGLIVSGLREGAANGYG